MTGRKFDTGSGGPTSVGRREPEDRTSALAARASALRARARGEDFIWRRTLSWGCLRSVARRAICLMDAVVDMEKPLEVKVCTKFVGKFKWMVFVSNVTAKQLGQSNYRVAPSSFHTTSSNYFRIQAMEEGARAKRTVFIGGINDEIDEEAIFEQFQTFGEVSVTCHLLRASC